MGTFDNNKDRRLSRAGRAGRARRGRVRTFAAALALAAALPLLGGTPSVSAAPSPQLIDRATAAGIEPGNKASWDVCVADFNGDGNTDFHASLHLEYAGALYRGNADGTFTRTANAGNTASPLNVVSPLTTPGYGPKSWVDRHGCAWADVDGNGLLDMYNSAGRYASNRVKEEGINNELWMQETPGVFRDYATRYGVGEKCTRGRHVVFEDFNRDGLPDLFLGTQVERNIASDPCNRDVSYPYIEQSKVFINRGRDATGAWLGFRYGPEFDVSLANTGASAALSWDQNRDGLPDLLTITFPNNVSYLHRNTGTGFQEVARSGVVRLPVMNGAAVGDITADGIADLVYTDNSGFYFRRGFATGFGSTVNRLGTIPSVGDGRRVALGDVNGDGLLDVYGLVAARKNTTGNPDDVIYVAQPGATTFVPHVVPSAIGDASDVEAITVGGRAQFVVVNGGDGDKDTPGPVQLIAWQD